MSFMMIALCAGLLAGTVVLAKRLEQLDTTALHELHMHELQGLRREGPRLAVEPGPATTWQTCSPVETSESPLIFLTHSGHSPGAAKPLSGAPEWITPVDRQEVAPSGVGV
jgi:hypothetical protein